jgi:hypothetical protein
MDTIVQPGAIKAGEKVTPLEKYWSLHEDTARMLGEFIGTKCKPDAVPLSERDLENLVSSYCQSLNMILQQRIADSVLRLSITNKMLSAFLDSFILVVDSQGFFVFVLFLFLFLFLFLLLYLAYLLIL